MLEFAMQRSRVIPVSAEAIYPLMIDFHKWTQWSPWESLDTDLERTYTGAESGVGARYGWAGKKAGAGTMEIVAAEPNASIDIDLNFTKPMKTRNLTQFTLEPVEGGTKVTWRMSGTQGVIGRFFYKLFNIEKGIGEDFEQGLASLETAAS